MGKTNDYRACELVAVWRYKHGAMVVDGVLDDLRDRVTTALDKAERRGAKKERIVCCKPAPQFDAEKVRYLIELYGHNRWQEGRQFGPNDNSVMSCDDFHNRAEYYGHRLLAALHIE